jgi:hypothetical protein
VSKSATAAAFQNIFMLLGFTTLVGFVPALFLSRHGRKPETESASERGE